MMSSGTAPVSRLIAEDRFAVLDMLADQWARVDRVTELPTEALYLPDAELQIGSLLLTGQAAITAHYENRRAQEDETGRRTRHIISNVRFDSFDEVEASFAFLAVVHAGVGTMPFAAAPPSTIADFSATCRHIADGWCFQSLHGTVVFAGAGAAPFAR